MHGVRRSLLEEQAASVDVPLWQVPLPWPCTNDQYESRMAEACTRAVAEGFDTIAFGDLYLQDVRAYRERQLAGSGLRPIFPLWQVPTAQLARDMISAGLRARLSCIDSRVLDPGFAGRDFDSTLLTDLPASTDPCGENGEFHSFVYAGPMFRAPIAIETGEVRNVDGFIYMDLLCPVSSR
jgi:diphthamide synthase (EF-2-diphthine--ammonia ligase)